MKKKSNYCLHFTYLKYQIQSLPRPWKYTPCLEVSTDGVKAKFYNNERLPQYYYVDLWNGLEAVLNIVR